MSSTYWGASAVVCGLLLTAAPVVAHHSVGAEYDFDKPVEMTGVLKRVDWVNPHTMFHLEVMGQDGGKMVWLFQTGNAGSLRRQKEFAGKRLVGETFTISGFAARNGKAQGFIKSLTMPDGHQVTMWFGDPNGN